MKRKGLTLIELIIVLVSIAILGMIICPSLVEYCKKPETKITAIIKLEDGKIITVDVDSWCTFHDGKQVKVITKDGTTYYAAIDNITIIKERSDDDESVQEIG